MPTYIPRGREAEELMVGKNWFVIDAEGVVLGRLATRIARLLIGKDKPTYTPHLDCGDHVVVVNAEKVKLTGNKIDQKLYRHHSGWPGGLKEIPIRTLLQRRPEEVVREAVLGMLPKNKLRARRAKKLRVYAGSEGLARHTGQKPQPLSL
ncbi:MAG: 50S ribosomal protein L13 [Candidatus Acidiferrales bacterium]